MIKTKQTKKDFSSIYVPVLGGLLLLAVFFIGRLTSQMEAMKKGVGGGVVVGQQEAAGAVNIGPVGLKEMASDLGLNKNKFESCLDEGKFEQRVKDDLAYGGEVGVSGTPTFFINKVMVVGSQPQSIFEAVIDYELAGGNWDSPTETVASLVDGDPQNGEVTIVPGEIKKGVGSIRGSDGASVKIVEFSDFECPFCKRTIPTIEALFEKYGDKISLEYRHFPLAIHASAEASECAGEQGKFWEMHDMIFGVQG